MLKMIEIENFETLVMWPLEKSSYHNTEMIEQGIVENHCKLYFLIWLMSILVAVAAELTYARF